MRPFLCLCSATRSTSGATEGKGGVVMSIWFLVGIESSDGIWARAPSWPPNSMPRPTEDVTEGSGWAEEMNRPLYEKKCNTVTLKPSQLWQIRPSGQNVCYSLYFGPPGLLLVHCSPDLVFPIFYGHLYDFWKKKRRINKLGLYSTHLMLRNLGWAQE